MADLPIDVEFAESVDRDGWDDAIRRMGGSVFHSSAWADYTVALHPGATPLYTTFRSAEGSPVARALAIVQRSPRPVLRALTASMWLDAHPLLEHGVPVEAGSVLRALVNGVRERVRAVELNLNSFASPGEGTALTRLGFSRTARLEFRLDLRRTEEDLWAGRFFKRRTDIRKAEKSGVKIVALTGADGVARLRALQGESSARIVQRGGPDIRFDAKGRTDPVTTLLGSGVGKLVGARHEGEIVSACLFTVFNETAYLTLAGHSRAGMKVQAPTYLLWKALCEFRSSGATHFNLGGCSADAVEKDSPEHGVYSYKRDFGGEMLECVSGRKILRPATRRSMDLLRGVMHRVRRR